MVCVRNWELDFPLGTGTWEVGDNTNLRLIVKTQRKLSIKTFTPSDSEGNNFLKRLVLVVLIGVTPGDPASVA